jgi:hypothetical protein
MTAAEKQAWKEYLILLAQWHSEMSVYAHDLGKWFVKAQTMDAGDPPTQPEPPKPPKGGDTPPPPDTP